MSVCVVAQHNNAKLDSSVGSAIAAASALDSDVTVLVAGHGCSAVADQVDKISCVFCIWIGFFEVLSHPKNVVSWLTKKIVETWRCVGCPV